MKDNIKIELVFNNNIIVKLYTFTPFLKGKMSKVLERPMSRECIYKYGYKFEEVANNSLYQYFECGKDINNRMIIIKNTLYRLRDLKLNGYIEVQPIITNNITKSTEIEIIDIFNINNDDYKLLPQDEYILYNNYLIKNCKIIESVSADNVLYKIPQLIIEAYKLFEYIKEKNSELIRFDLKSEYMRKIQEIYYIKNILDSDYDFLNQKYICIEGNKNINISREILDILIKNTEEFIMEE